MSILNDLEKRANNQCELCSSKTELSFMLVAPKTEENTDSCLYLCAKCKEQIQDPEKIDVHHWRCLNDSMWSQHAPVQVMASRILKHLKDEGWAQDLLGMLYLEDSVQEWADSIPLGGEQEEKVIHRDCNGIILERGDSVVLIKDLVVKGGGFTAKRGTAVRNINLDPDNETYIEGRVDGQKIVIITEYVKKS